jgi:DNA helicase-2/ATP-dependent DNA helicase PcrA
MNNQIRLKDIAILYRTNAQALAIENACRQYNIPYIVVGGMSFYKRKEVKDVLAYFQILLNPSDNISLQRIINEPPRGIGPTSIDKIDTFAVQHSISFFDALNHIDKIDIRQKKTILNINEFRELINKHRELVRQNAAPEHLVEYIEKTGIVKFYKDIDTIETQDRVRNIEQLLTDVFSYLKLQNTTLQGYLEQTALINDIDIKDFNADVLTIMTAHSAKGLEYDYVYIVGMENDLFPLPAREEDNTEEERRLFYVGITRAKKELTLSYCAKRQKFGQFIYNPPSLFLKEIDEDLLLDEMENTFLYDNKKEYFSDIKQQFNQPRTFNQYRPIPEKKPYPAFDDMQYEDNYSQIPNSDPFTSVQYKAGDIVQHNQFGLGKITAVSGLGDGLKLTIFFGNVGKKQLIAKYANLVKVES